MMIRISLGLIWLLLAAILFCLILFRRWMKKKTGLSHTEHHQPEVQDSAPGETSETTRNNP